MLFSKAQQAAMNLVADLMSETKKDFEEEVIRVKENNYTWEPFTSAEKEVTYLLKDAALRVKVTVETVKVVTE